MMVSMSQRLGGSTPKALQAFCRHPYVFASEKIGVETMMMPSLNLKASFRGSGELDLLFRRNMNFGATGLSMGFRLPIKVLIAVDESIVDLTYIRKFYLTCSVQFCSIRNEPEYIYF